MVGQSTATKPSRSDEVLEADQQIKIANQIRAHFDSITPKRPIKPNRSEPDSSSPIPIQTVVDHTIPELDKLRSLQTQSKVILSPAGAVTAPEEFVETDYYRQLESIDKEHHTTGSGFIRAVKEGEDGYTIEVREGDENGGGGLVPVAYRSNPATNDWDATNDWIEDRIFISSKPNRSESS
ncbi:hypothetical protein UlMin_039136 [Ulmus minor]